MEKNKLVNEMLEEVAGGQDWEKYLESYRRVAGKYREGLEYDFRRKGIDPEPARKIYQDALDYIAEEYGIPKEFREVL